MIYVLVRYKQEDACFYTLNYGLNDYSWGNGKLEVCGMGILRGQIYPYVNLCFLDKSRDSFLRVLRGGGVFF